MVKISDKGVITVTSEEFDSKSFAVEVYVKRINALIDILKEQNTEFQGDETRLDILDILTDYMPTLEQAEVMFHETEIQYNNIVKARRKAFEINEKERLSKEFQEKAKKKGWVQQEVIQK